MGMTKDELFEVLDNGLSESVIEIQDLAGDNDHYAVKIISNKFKGLSKKEVMNKKIKLKKFSKNFSTFRHFQNLEKILSN